MVKTHDKLKQCLDKFIKTSLYKALTKTGVGSQLNIVCYVHMHPLAYNLPVAVLGFLHDVRSFDRPFRLFLAVIAEFISTVSRKL